MAKRSTPSAARRPLDEPLPLPPLRVIGPPARRGGDLVGLGWITGGVLLLVGLHSGGAGPVVHACAAALLLLLGRLAELAPYVMFYLGARWLLRGQGHPTAGLSGTFLLLALTAAGLLHNVVPVGEELARTALGRGWLHPPEQHGGLLGLASVYVLRHLFGPVGCPLVLGMTALGSALLLSERTLRELMAGFGEGLARVQERQRQRALAVQARRALAPPRLDTPTVRPGRGTAKLKIADLSFPEPDAAPPAAPEPAPLPPVAPPAMPARAKKATPPAALPPLSAPLLGTLDTPFLPALPAAAVPAPPPTLGPLPPLHLPAPTPASEPVSEPEPEAEVSGELPPLTPKFIWPEFTSLKREPVTADNDAPWDQMVLPGMPSPQRRRGHTDSSTVFPTVPQNLIEPPPAPPLPDRSPEIRANSQRLESTLASFRIEARVVNTEIGPTVTRYELELAPGIRVSKVAVLSDDIAMALATAGIRIEAPVPGKGVIGIEVPNQIRETVDLSAMLESPEFKNAAGPLPFIIGKDIAGHAKIVELTRMPHCLVAGTTNSGKSVCLNSLIISLIYRLSPRDLRFLMIDPKRVELTLYDGIPHLDRPVVTDASDAADLLRGAVREMMARYDRLHELGARNIVTYNERVTEAERMPYIVIIIDELAELMMLCRAEVEESIVRLAQLARATGIHLVVATQRPSVNVVTGLIKANIGTRLAFKVAQQVDSRVILDQVGAERLIGRGDMLYSAVEAGGKPERLQGAFVGEEQVHRLVEWLQALPSTLRAAYADSIIQPVSADAGTEGGESAVDDTELDDLFWECVQLIRSEGEGSTSRLQRTFGIGYNRAGRIMDQMFAMGIVGPPRGSKPREVLPGGPLPPADRRRGGGLAGSGGANVPAALDVDVETED